MCVSFIYIIRNSYTSCRSKERKDTLSLCAYHNFERMSLILKNKNNVYELSKIIIFLFFFNLNFKF